MSVTERILTWCDEWNSEHPWDHNAHHHAWLLRRVPERFGVALDVGCGTGELVRRMAQRAERVTGIDADPATVQIARGLSPGVTVLVGDLMTADLPAGNDVITALAVLHHVPCQPALIRLRDLLAPGGTLVVLGLYREQTLVDRVIGVLAIPANVLLGGLKNWRRNGPERPVSMTPPTAPATMTYTEIRRAAGGHLPGAVLRRHLFWRYSLVYRAP